MKSYLNLFLILTLLLTGCLNSIGNHELDLSAEEKLGFDLAQEQLDAYNARDIDKFMAVYSDSVMVYRFPDELLMQGHDEMRKRYASMFESTPDLNCLLVKRMVQGNTVIDQELVTRKIGEPKSQAIAIYKIENGKIQEVRFIQ